jgi:hypothetical protein
MKRIASACLGVHRRAPVLLMAPLIFSALIHTGAFAETPTVQGCNCTSLDESLVDGFFARALLTDEENWRDKWDSPSNQVVNFNTINSVWQGDSAVLLVFFANAKLNGIEAEIECDLKISKPDGNTQAVPPTKCYFGPVIGSNENLRLTGFWVEMKVDAADPKGLWTFEVGVRDVLRGVRIPLEVSLMVDSAAKVLQ